MPRRSRRKPPKLPPSFRVRWSDVFGEHEERYNAFSTALKRYQSIKSTADRFLLPDTETLTLEVQEGLEWLRYK